MTQPAPLSRRPMPGKTEFVAMMALLMALNAAAIDIYIPALTDIGQALAAGGENRQQFIITVYVLAFGVSQIVYGPLADRFGRRKTLFAGLLIFILASVGASFAGTFQQLLLWRILQGIGAASTRVIVTAVVRDRFAGADMASVMSLVMMVFMIMPVIAPNLGSLILIFGNWRLLSVFVCVSGLTALIWTALRLPETLPPDQRRPIRGRRLAESFRIVFTNRLAFGYTMALGTFFGALFSLIVLAEQLYTETYEKGPAFTLYFALVASLMALASFVNSRLVQMFGARRLAHGALVIFIVLHVLYLILTVTFHGIPPFGIFIGLMILTMACFGFVGANLNSIAMEPMGHVAGVASSVIGAFQMGGGMLIGGLVGAFYDGTLYSFVIGNLLSASVALGLVAFAERGRLFYQQPSGVSD
ncbi:multidrug effflux MFS transporter [Palleronia caenipelagi]|uniref:Bcr/CflA family efflux transporter n=1 Tax=Palleronia caenipelagi TaxID=2489174 RepID=A0A547Q7Q8_9RHOB|nr:multidrug effflux MFS transporter [Palleronia caenipelagi]TRD22420.1 multidrug effflux MFS transporter [Palleronia caenipelagi]